MPEVTTDPKFEPSSPSYEDAGAGAPAAFDWDGFTARDAAITQRLVAACQDPACGHSIARHFAFCGTCKDCGCGLYVPSGATA